MAELVPTALLRWVNRALGPRHPSMHILQQWWAPAVPEYMRDPAVGEWRDVPLEPE